MRLCCVCEAYLLRIGFCWLLDESIAHESLCLRVSRFLLTRLPSGAEMSVLLLLSRLLERRPKLVSSRSPGLFCVGTEYTIQLGKKNHR